MNDFPEDIEDKGMCYIDASTKYEYGHLKARFRVPALKRTGMLDSVEITQAAQFGGISDIKRVEQSYGWHLTMSSCTDGLEAPNLERVVKEMRRIEKGVKAMGTIERIEDQIVALIVVTKVKYVYLSHRLNQSCRIPDMDMVTCNDGFAIAKIHSKIVGLKQLLIEARP